MTTRASLKTCVVDIVQAAGFEKSAEEKKLAEARIGGSRNDSAAQTQTVGLGPSSTARVNRVAQPYLLCAGQTAAKLMRPSYGAM
jgi:hypothetical protein